MKNNISIFRNELNITQNQLAKSANISIEDLDAIENNQLEPTLIGAYKITKALKKDFIADVFHLNELD